MNNLTADTVNETRNYTYDSHGNLSKSVKTVNTDNSTVTTNYVYDDVGNRISMTEGGVTTTYSYNQLDQLMQQTSGGVTVKYSYDRKGNTSIIKEDGTLSASYDYTDFGETTDLAGNDFDNQICYTGGIYDKETGLYYLNARYYDPEIGRFISQDSYRGELDDPGQWHLYAYCANNPINYVDPSGHVSEAVRMGVGVYRVAKVAAIIGSSVSYGGVILVITAVVCVYVIGRIAYSKVKAKKKTTKKSNKEKSSDFPNWVKHYKPRPDENGKSFAKRICDDRFGKGKYDRGPTSDYNRIKKARDRGAIK